jgi:hypothetical protein
LRREDVCDPKEAEIVETRGDRFDDARWERWAGLGAIAYVVLTVVWGLLIRQGPGLEDSTETITSYYADEGNQGQIFFATVLVGLAGILFLWFLGSVRAALRRAEGGAGTLSAVAFAGGVLLVAISYVKNSIEPAIATAVDRAEEFTLDPSTEQLLDSFFLALLIHESLAAAVLVGAASIVALRSGLFPRWFGWVGVVVAVANVAALFVSVLPLLAFLAWVLVAGVLVWRGVGPRQETG